MARSPSRQPAWRRTCFAGLFALVLLPATSARAALFNDIVSFGDSLSDTGNLFEVTSDGFNAFLLGILFPELDPPIPGPPYYQGRFSNGPIWIERFATRLAVGSPLPSELGGTNYAVGGATTFDDGNFFINLVLPDDVEDQVDAYLGSRTPTGQELFIVEGGANDLVSGGVTDAPSSAQNLIGFISALHAAGGRHFLVPNLPPLGFIPGERGGPDEAILNSRAQSFNAHLDGQLDLLEQTLASIVIHRIDFHARFLDVLDDPAAFGFQNVTDPAFDETTGTVVPNPDTYLFWDNIHPTAPAHFLLGNLAADVVLNVPEPGCVAMVVASPLLLIRSRRPARSAPHRVT